MLKLSLDTKTLLKIGEFSLMILDIRGDKSKIRVHSPREINIRLLNNRIQPVTFCRRLNKSEKFIPYIIIVKEPDIVILDDEVKIFIGKPHLHFSSTTGLRIIIEAPKEIRIERIKLNTYCKKLVKNRNI